MNKGLLFLIPVALAGGMEDAPGATLCVRSTGSGGCFTTIQAAVNAASPGDTIRVYPHQSYKGYTENVSIATANLTVDGGTGSFQWGNNRTSGGIVYCPNVIVDTCETASFPNDCGGTGFEISAPGVTIRNLTIRHADDAVLILAGADNTRIEGICSIENDGGVEATAAPTNNVRVIGSKFLGNHDDKAIDLDGDDAQVRNNVLLSTDGVEIDGARAQVTGNTINLTEDDQCILVSGDDAVIQGNTLEACAAEGIGYYGSGGQISSNSIRSNPDDTSGLLAEGDDITIRSNWVADVGNAGIALYSFTNGTVVGNRVERAGNDEDSNEAGILLESAHNNRIESNITINNSFAGILNVDSDNNTYLTNQSTFNGESGLRIASGEGNVLDKNLARNNQGEGINNGSNAADTTATRSTALDNRTDVCNDGTFATFASNLFVTGGTTTPCVVEQ